jgi:hypothetical protein
MEYWNIDFEEKGLIFKAPFSNFERDGKTGDEEIYGPLS